MVGLGLLGMGGGHGGSGAGNRQAQESVLRVLSSPPCDTNKMTATDQSEVKNNDSFFVHTRLESRICADNASSSSGSINEETRNAFPL